MNLKHIYLIGMMGSGKSYWGKELAKLAGCVFYDLDDLLIKEECRSINQIFDESGEKFFRDKETELLQRSFSFKEPFVIATGGGVPCFHNNMDLMNLNGLTFWINEPVEVLYERLTKEKSHRPLLKELSDEGLKDFISTKLEQRKPFYSQAQYKVTSEDIIQTFTTRVLEK